jgi:hypothetical protein
MTASLNESERKTDMVWDLNNVWWIWKVDNKIKLPKQQNREFSALILISHHNFLYVLAVWNPVTLQADVQMVISEVLLCPENN